MFIISFDRKSITIDSENSFLEISRHIRRSSRVLSTKRREETFSNLLHRNNKSFLLPFKQKGCLQKQFFTYDTKVGNLSSNSSQQQIRLYQLPLLKSLSLLHRLQIVYLHHQQFPILSHNHLSNLSFSADGLHANEFKGFSRMITTLTSHHFFSP